MAGRSKGGLPRGEVCLSALFFCLCLFHELPAATASPAGPVPLPEVLHVLVVGDWGREGRGCQDEVAARMAEYAGAEGVDFVVSTGDNFYDNGVNGVDDRRWRTSFEGVYRAEALQVQWYAVLGNHDYRGSTAAQIEYGARDGRWRMPARYYAFERAFGRGSSALFVFLDTSPFVRAYRWLPGRYPDLRSQNPKDQLRWLENTLAGSRAPWKIVVGHHPVYSSGDLHGPTKELQQQLLPLLERYGVQVYLSGHEHNLQLHKPPGATWYVISGGGSSPRSVTGSGSALFTRASCGFAAMGFEAGTLRLRLIDHRGAVLHRASIPVQSP